MSIPVTEYHGSPTVVCDGGEAVWRPLARTVLSSEGDIRRTFCDGSHGQQAPEKLDQETSRDDAGGCTGSP
jgi:hypothetical protein